MPTVYNVVVPSKYDGNPRGRKPKLRRGREILSLRKRGYTLQEIAEVYSVSKQRVDQVIDYMLERVHTEKQLRRVFKEEYDQRYSKWGRR